MLALAVAQFLISPEILATMLLMAAVAAGVSLALLPEARRVLWRGIGWTALGLLGFAVVCSPLLLTMLANLPRGLLNQPTGFSVFVGENVNGDPPSTQRVTPFTVGATGALTYNVDNNGVAHNLNLDKNGLNF